MQIKNISGLLKHGYNNFSLEIIEYCEPFSLLERENYYFMLLKPEYNISKVAGSPMLGRKHAPQKKLWLRWGLDNALRKLVLNCQLL
jgi:group I intron endonuclease